MSPKHVCACRGTWLPAPLLLLVLLVLVAAAACTRPLTDEQRLTRGREIVQRVSDVLGSAQAFSVVTDEVRLERQPVGRPRPVILERETVVRRNPDRLHFRTSGDRDTEGWYDGVGLSLVSHKDKVFAQARMPETLDQSLDAIAERYGVVLPFAEFLYTSPIDALIADGSSGGWIDTETVEREETDHVAFKNPSVDWDIWVARTGDRLPRRFTARFHDDSELNAIDVTFHEWNLMPDVTPVRFVPNLPADYEGIALVRRGGVLHVPDDETER